MTHFMYFPDRQTWEAFGWEPDGPSYARGPNGQFADIIGQNYFTDGEVFEERPGFLVNILGDLPEEMAQYKTAEPNSPKRRFL